MPLTLTATVGPASANSFATVAEATAIASYRIGGAAFIALTADQQIQALVTATRDIDSIEGTSPGTVGGFVGERTDATQALAWPRTGTDYADDELPACLVSACIELAISYTPLFATGATGDALNADPTSGNVKSEQVSTIKTEYFAPTADVLTSLARFPAVVQRLLLSLVVIVVENAWGSSTASRNS